MLSEKQIDRMLAKLVRFEMTLEEQLFEKIDHIDVSRYETMERHHSLPQDKSYIPCHTGDGWGQEGSYCWFIGRYTVPEKHANKKLYLYPKTGGYETMLWVDGKVSGVYASKLIVNSHGNHYCNMICKESAANQTIDIALESYAGHSVKGCHPFDDLQTNDFTYQFSSLDVCVKNEIVSEFLFDLKTLNQMVAALDKNSFRRADIVRALMEVHSIVYYSYENVERETFLEALREALPVLKDRLNKTNSETAPFAGFIGHSHMDTAWLWPIDETIKKCARTFSNQLNLMSQYEDYVFIQSSACHTDMVRSHYPDLFEEIKERVAQGRYEPNGGVWIECDCNIPSGEYLVRQFLWGQRFTQKYFGYKSDVFWLPDTFGYSAAIPQIMKGSCVKYFLTTKMAWNDTTQFPYDTFYWKGIDGTRTLTHLNRTHIWPEPKSMMEYVVDGKMNNDAIKEKTVSDMRLISYGFGDGGGGPQFEMIEMTKRLKDLEGLPRSSHTTVSEFMKKLEKTIFRPSTYSGELYLQLHRGTLTNQHTIKRNNRLAEIALHDLEFMTVLHAVENDQIADGQDIQPLMNTLLVNQFHDILPGTCIPAVHDRSIRETTSLIQKAGHMIHMIQAKGDDDKADNDKPDNENLRHVVNTLSFKRDDVIYLEADEGFILNGEFCQQITENIHGVKKLAVAGIRVQPFGSVNVTLTPGVIENHTVFGWNGSRLETPFAIVFFDDEGISSFVDKENGRELKGEGYSLNTFLMAEDVPQAWDNWDIDSDYELKLKPCAELIKREVVSMGAVEFRLRVQYKLSALSTLMQDIIFYADSPEVRFETLIDWNDSHRLLKTVFSTTMCADFARQETQFGYIKRPTSRNNDEEKAKFEVCNHKYSDLSESRYGVAILNDCKYGISVHHGELALTLHKGGCRPDDRGDKGVHECVYSFYPHHEPFAVENVVRKAYELNYHPLVSEGHRLERSFIQVSESNIVIETIKPCEDADKAFILRLYDAEGTYTRTRLRFGFSVKKLEETNMLEETMKSIPCSNEVELVFGAFEIKTIKVFF